MFAWGEERTVDVRLLPAAVCAWAIAFLGTAHPVSIIVAVVVAVLCAVIVAVAAAARRHRPAHSPRTVAIGTWTGAALLVVVVALAMAAATAAHVHARTTSAFVQLATATRSVTADVTFTADPIERATATGGLTHRAAATVTAVMAANGSVTRSNPVPVLILGGEDLTAAVRGTRALVSGRTMITPDGEDIAAIIYASSIDSRSPPNPVISIVNRIRAAARDLPAAWTGPAAPTPWRDGAALIPAIGMGDRSRVSAELDEAMKVAGLTHLTAVSGAHCAIVLGSLTAVLTALGLGRPFRVCVIALALAGFVMLVGSQPSIVRAGSMAAVQLVALAAGRRSVTAPALAATIVGTLMIDPWLAQSFGFVLSVAAVAAITLVAPSWARWLHRYLPDAVAQIVAVSAAAQAACAPIVVLFAPGLITLAVPANIVAGPFVAAATVLSVLGAIIAVITPSVGSVLLWGAQWPSAAIALAARMVAAVPGARLPWPGGVGGAGALTLGTVAAVAMMAWLGRRLSRVINREAPARRRRWRVIAACAVVVIGGIPVLRAAATAARPPWLAVVCDVGQGAALVMATGNGTAVAVDVGPDESIGRCLRALKVRTIDLLVITHDHADHWGGLATVLDGWPVGDVILAPTAGPARAQIVELIEEHAVSWHTARPAESGTIGEAHWSLDAPAAVVDQGAIASGTSSGGEERLLNDRGLVVRLDTPSLSVEALGDRESAGQEALVSTAGPVDVVVMAHHGSASQSERLAAALAPRLAVIPVGRNDYGHPTAAAIELYSGYGRIERTDRCGDTAISAEHDTLVVRCLNGS